MIQQSTKRFCSSVVRSNSVWFPVVAEELVDPIPMQSMLVATIREPSLTPQIIDLVERIYSWKSNSLKHVRRLNRSEDSTEVLLYPVTHGDRIEKEDFDKYFIGGTRQVDVPTKPCLVRRQYEECLARSWRNIVFRENTILENCLRPRPIDDQQRSILDLLESLERRSNSSNCAIVYERDNPIPLVAAADYRHEKPLEHSAMVAIDCLSERPIYSRPNLVDELFDKQTKKNYLLNGCSIYLSREPCLMCSMALLHSRIETVFFVRPNRSTGALLSNYKLHTLKKTNHRFAVYCYSDDETNLSF